VTARKDQGGVTSIEFALVSVVFFMLLVGIFEVGVLLYGLSSMTNGAREGARYGVASLNNISGHLTACDNTTPALAQSVRNVASGVPLASIDATTNLDGNGNPQSCTVTVTWDYRPASGFFSIMKPHTFTSVSTLYFQNNLQ
jgi:Flp pilus assembly protein TadG